MARVKPRSLKITCLLGGVSFDARGVRGVVRLDRLRWRCVGWDEIRLYVKRAGGWNL